MYSFTKQMKNNIFDLVEKAYYVNLNVTLIILAVSVGYNQKPECGPNCVGRHCIFHLASLVASDVSE